MFATEEKKQNLEEDGAAMEDKPSLEEKEKSEEDGATTEDRPPVEKKQKLEGDDDFFIPYYDRETYYKKFNDHSLQDKDAILSDDEERDFTEEEEKMYRDAINSTGGFDVPKFPGVSCWGLILPKSVNEHTLEYLLPMSIAAIQIFNDKYKTKYKVVQVEKAMQEAAARGLNLYITFLARPETDDDCNSDTTKTFEALVLMGTPGEKGRGMELR